MLSKILSLIWISDDMEKVKIYHLFTLKIDNKSRTQNIDDDKLRGISKSHDNNFSIKS